MRAGWRQDTRELKEFPGFTQLLSVNDVTKLS